MEQKEIEKIFDEFFNGMKNPVFFNPVLYFEHNDFLCEVAKTEDFKNTKIGMKRFVCVNPLDVLELLLVDDGMWITVLERKSEGEYEHRTDLCCHICIESEINGFIERLN